MGYANKYYVYMFGEKGDVTKQDTEVIARDYAIENLGFYKLGKNSGYLLMGTFDALEDCFENYFGLEIVDDYLTEYDDFDFDDGKFLELKKSTHKSLKESISDNDITFKVATTMKEVSNLRLDKEFDYMFDKKTLCDMIWYICDELNADYKFHLYPKYDHGTQIRVDFIRDSVNVGWMAFDVMIKDTYPLTVEIENMLEK